MEAVWCCEREMEAVWRCAHNNNAVLPMIINSKYVFAGTELNYWLVRVISINSRQCPQYAFRSESDVNLDGQAVLVAIMLTAANQALRSHR